MTRPGSLKMNFYQNANLQNSIGSIQEWLDQFNFLSPFIIHIFLQSFCHPAFGIHIGTSSMQFFGNWSQQYNFTNNSICSEYAGTYASIYHCRDGRFQDYKCRRRGYYTRSPNPRPGPLRLNKYNFSI